MVEPLAGKKLLLLVNDAGFFLSHRLPLALGAQAAGMEVIIATAADPLAEQVRASGLQFAPLPLSRSGRNPLQEARLFAALLALYRRHRPDVAHHVTIKPVLYGGLAARLLRLPAVVSAVSGLGYVFISQGRLAALRRRAVVSLYRLALGGAGHRVIFQNPDDRAAFESASLLRSGSAVLLPGGSGVDLRRFRPQPEPDGDVLVVLPARMLWDKGVGEFVEAARILRGRGIKARFQLAGGFDPANPAAIAEAQLRAWQAEGVIEWLGHCSDMPAVYAGANIVCLPSYREGLPKALIEAAACGRALVATDVPGCREICRHQVNGLLAPVREAAGLAGALGRLIEDTALRASYGLAGRRIAEAEYGVDAVVARTLDLYRDLLARDAAAKLPAKKPNQQECK